MRKIDVQNFQRATRDTSREVNRTIVLNLVREHGPVSRADLARLMGISRGMITPLVNELLDEGLVYEGATTRAPRGRRPTLIHLRCRDRLVVGVDVRASRTALRLGDFCGSAVACTGFATPPSPEAFVDLLAAEIAALLAANPGIGTCEGVGIVVPGMVDARSGRILNLPTLGWRDLDLTTPLAERTGLPVSIERDAVACAMARIWMGDGDDDEPRDFAYLVVSEGVGAGLVVNGQPVRGSHFSAGEFGHLPLAVDGPLCSCGSRGCLEALASDTATVLRYLDLDGEGRCARSQVEASGVTIDEVIALARSGDARARRAVDDTAFWVGRGLAAIVSALNPQRVVVGGPLTGAWELVAPTLVESVRERALTRAAAETRIVADRDHAATRLQGASSLVVAPTFAAPAVG